MAFHILITQETSFVAGMIKRGLEDTFAGIIITEALPQVQNSSEILSKHCQLIFATKPLKADQFQWRYDNPKQAPPMVLFLDHREKELTDRAFWEQQYNVIEVIRKPFEYQQLVEFLASHMGLQFRPGLKKELPSFEVMDTEMFAAFNPTSQPNFLPKFDAVEAGPKALPNSNIAMTGGIETVTMAINTLPNPPIEESEHHEVTVPKAMVPESNFADALANIEGIDSADKPPLKVKDYGQKLFDQITSNIFNSNPKAEPPKIELKKTIAEPSLPIAEGKTSLSSGDPSNFTNLIATEFHNPEKPTGQLAPIVMEKIGADIDFYGELDRVEPSPIKQDREKAYDNSQPTTRTLGFTIGQDFLSDNLTALQVPAYEELPKTEPVEALGLSNSGAIPPLHVSDSFSLYAKDDSMALSSPKASIGSLPGEWGSTTLLNDLDFAKNEMAFQEPQEEMSSFDDIFSSEAGALQNDTEIAWAAGEVPASENLTGAAVALEAFAAKETDADFLKLDEQKATLPTQNTHKEAEKFLLKTNHFEEAKGLFNTYTHPNERPSADDWSSSKEEPPASSPMEEFSMDDHTGDFIPDKEIRENRKQLEVDQLTAANPVTLPNLSHPSPSAERGDIFEDNAAPVKRENEAIADLAIVVEASDSSMPTHIDDNFLGELPENLDFELSSSQVQPGVSKSVNEDTQPSHNLMDVALNHYIDPIHTEAGQNFDELLSEFSKSESPPILPETPQQKFSAYLEKLKGEFIETFPEQRRAEIGAENLNSKLEEIVLPKVGVANSPEEVATKETTVNDPLVQEFNELKSMAEKEEFEDRSFNPNVMGLVSTELHHALGQPRALAGGTPGSLTTETKNLLEVPTTKRVLTTEDIKNRLKPTKPTTEKFAEYLRLIEEHIQQAEEHSRISKMMLKEFQSAPPTV